MTCAKCGTEVTVRAITDDGSYARCDCGDTTLTHARKGKLDLGPAGIPPADPPDTEPGPEGL